MNTYELREIGFSSEMKSWQWFFFFLSFHFYREDAEHFCYKKYFPLFTSVHCTVQCTDSTQLYTLIAGTNIFYYKIRIVKLLFYHTSEDKFKNVIKMTFLTGFRKSSRLLYNIRIRIVQNDLEINKLFQMMHVPLSERLTPWRTNDYLVLSKWFV